MKKTDYRYFRPILSLFLFGFVATIFMYSACRVASQATPSKIKPAVITTPATKEPEKKQSNTVEFSEPPKEVQSQPTKIIDIAKTKEKADSLATSELNAQLEYNLRTQDNFIRALRLYRQVITYKDDLINRKNHTIHSLTNQKEATQDEKTGAEIQKTTYNFGFVVLCSLQIAWAIIIICTLYLRWHVKKLHRPSTHPI